MEPSRPPYLLPAAVLAPLGVAALLSTVRAQVPTPNAVLVLVLVIVAVGAAGSRLAGVVAAVSCATWFDFFLTEPYLRLTIADRDDVETAVLLTLVGVAVTELALWGRRQQARASRGAGYLSAMRSAAGMVAQGPAADRVVLDFVGRQIEELLGADSCRYVTGPPGAHPRLMRDGSVLRGGKAVAVDRGGLPSDDVIEIPVELGGQVLGRFVVTAASRTSWPTADQRRVAAALADQVAPTLTPA